jgi:pyruvate dehydrogenase E2 component (dihydrolipoamide acetyltransferase)
MATEVLLPALSESVSGGDVVDVKVKVGDTVGAGQTLFEIEAEKTTAEVTASAAGRIAKVLVKKGDHVTTGQLLAVLDGDGGSPSTAAAKSETLPPKSAATAKPVPSAAPVAESPPLPAAAKPAAAPHVPAAPTPPPVIHVDDAAVPAGPATRALAREWGVPLGQVAATGPFGRVTREDVKAHVRKLANGTAAPGASGMPTPALPDFSKWGPVEYKPVESVRKRTAEHMSLCWSLIPHVTQHDLADVTDVEAFRKQQEGKGPKLTVTAFVLKAVAILLKQMPQFNSSLDWDNKQLVLKQYYHIGIAVDTERGLVVPVLRDVDKKSVHDIGREMTEVAERARAGKLTPDDMQGATFTISNLGGIGGTSFTPIVNWPQVAILGLSRSRHQPVLSKEGQFVPRLLMPLSLSYDHRVIDGADAARFARKLAELLENPMVMLLHA